MGVLQSTVGYWRYYGVIEDIGGYGGVLWGTVGYCWVLLGVGWYSGKVLMGNGGTKEK